MGQKGPEASEVTVIAPGSMAADGTPAHFFSGTIKAYDAEKGWGFITGEELRQNFGKDVFIHKHALAGHVATPGEQVQFNVAINEQGRAEATNVTIVGAAPVVGLGGAADFGRQPQTLAGFRSTPY